MTPDQIVRASIARQDINSPCHKMCADGSLCQYHEGMWDGAEEAFRQADDTTTERLRAEVSLLREELAETRDLYDIRRRAHNESARSLKRAEALISWIDGKCVDEAPHVEIRDAINRYRENA